MQKFNVKLINKSSLETPTYASNLSSGFDIRTNLKDLTNTELLARKGFNFEIGHDNRIVLFPLSRYLFPTGLYVAIPEGLEIQVRSRSGNAINKGFACLNSPGTIDADYRGEIGVIITNLSEETIVIEHGDKIAQGVLCPIFQVNFELVDNLDETARGDGGFGTSDTKEYNK